MSARTSRRWRRSHPPTRYPHGLWLNNPGAWIYPEGNSFAFPEPLQFFDGRDLHTVPAWFVSDGASIPQWAWSIVGSPLDRRYRRAAALHDWYCLTQRIPAHQAHRLFYECLRATGVHPVRAAAFYAAVTIHRPRWAAQAPPVSNVAFGSH